MHSEFVNVYVFICIFGAIVVIVVLVAFGLTCCLDEMKKREVQKREKYLENIKTFIVATSTLADATTRVPE